MTAPERGYNVSGHSLGVEHAAPGAFPHGAHEFEAATRERGGKTLLVALRRQNHAKASFAMETGRRSLVDYFDGWHVGVAHWDTAAARPMTANAHAENSDAVRRLRVENVTA
jgi:hypothetical protein